MVKVQTGIHVQKYILAVGEALYVQIQQHIHKPQSINSPAKVIAVVIILMRVASF